MIAITEYYFKNFGLTVPEACVEVEEVSARVNESFYTEDGNKNTLVRIKVWASQEAKTTGLQPLEQSEKFINIDPSITQNIHSTTLAELFPNALFL